MRPSGYTRTVQVLLWATTAITGCFSMVLDENTWGETPTVTSGVTTLSTGCCHSDGNSISKVKMRNKFFFASQIKPCFRSCLKQWITAVIRQPEFTYRGSPITWKSYTYNILIVAKRSRSARVTKKHTKIVFEDCLFDEDWILVFGAQ